MRTEPKDVSLALQVAAMRSYFPQFRRIGSRQGVTWTGHLQPTKDSPKYEVKLSYNLGSLPKVWILNPSIVDDAPHRYPDQSLCLYYPHDRSWSPAKHIFKTIIPWTSEWLAYYEVWCLTGIWYGKEVPHEGENKL